MHAVVADVANGDAAAAAVREAVTRLGGLDVLFTNSGGPPAGLFESLDEAAWRKAVDLLLFSTVRMVKEALPSLTKSPQPRIVHLTSLTVKQPVHGLVLSNAVRAAVVGLAKSLSQELAERQVLVNVVAPGIIDTERVRELDEANAAAQKRPVEEVASERITTIPLGRMGQAEEVANLVVFLASKRGELHHRHHHRCRRWADPRRLIVIAEAVTNRLRHARLSLPAHASRPPRRRRRRSTPAGAAWTRRASVRWPFLVVPGYTPRLGWSRGLHPQAAARLEQAAVDVAAGLASTIIVAAARCTRPTTRRC